MRKMFLLLAAMLYMTVSAKEVKIGNTIWRNLSFDVADGLECVYNFEDSVKDGHSNATEGNLRYVFTSSDGMELYVYFNMVENIDVTKACAAPDTTLLPGIKGIEVIERQQPVEGDLDRIITIKNKKGILQREYIGFCAVGMISFSAIAPSGDFSLADQTANTLKSSINWSVILLGIVCIIVMTIPSFIMSSALDKRKTNMPKAWKRALASLGLSIALGIAASLFGVFNMLTSIFVMLLWNLAGTLMIRYRFVVC